VGRGQPRGRELPENVNWQTRISSSSLSLERVRSCYDTRTMGGSAHNVLRHILENNPLSLQIQRELVDEKKDISQTAAGAELNRELMLQIQRHKEEMKELQAEMQGMLFDHERRYSIQSTSIQRPSGSKTKKRGANSK
jgi:hypothetical protein